MKTQPQKRHRKHNYSARVRNVVIGLYKMPFKANCTSTLFRAVELPIFSVLN